MKVSGITNKRLYVDLQSRIQVRSDSQKFMQIRIQDQTSRGNSVLLTCIHGETDLLVASCLYLPLYRSLRLWPAIVTYTRIKDIAVQALTCFSLWSSLTNAVKAGTTHYKTPRTFTRSKGNWKHLQLF